MKVRELLTKDSWIKEIAVANAEGIQVDNNSPEAVKFCLLGAIYECYPQDETRLKVISRLATAIDSACALISIWNDAPERTFDDVKKVIDELDI